MTERLSPEERALLIRASRPGLASPIPLQVVSNGEFLPAPQGELQKKFAARLRERADVLAKKRGSRAVPSSIPPPAWRRRSSP